MSNITYGELYRLTLDELFKITESASAEASMLFKHCFGFDRIAITINSAAIADVDGARKLQECLDKRKAHFPIQYILGKRNFYDYDFIVGEGVLIPRPETEMLVEQAVEFVKGSNLATPVIFDLCSGSGCVGISIAKLLPNSKVYVFEKSKVALEYIRTNAELNGASNVVIVECDIFDGIPQGIDKPDVIVSNPPYIPTADIADLEAEVKQEPVMALDGGADGLDFYHCICTKWLLGIDNSVFFALEFGIYQSQDISKIFGAVSENVCILKDFNGIDRVVCGNT